MPQWIANFRGHHFAFCKRVLGSRSGHPWAVWALTFHVRPQRLREPRKPILPTGVIHPTTAGPAHESSPPNQDNPAHPGPIADISP